MSDQLSNQSILEGMRKYWVLLVFVGGLIVGWTTIRNDIANLQIENQRLEAQIVILQKDGDRTGEQVNQFKADIAVIKNDLTSIKDALRIK